MTEQEPRGEHPDDAGFSLMEVVVAMTVMTGMVVAALGLMLNTLDGSRHNAQRVQAAGVAARQVEAVRGAAASTIPDGTITPSGSPVVVDGTAYSVQQSAALLTGDGTTSVCSSTAERPTYKRVTVTVTWPDMGSIPPVRSDTLVAVGLGATGPDATKGTAAILVRDAQAVPLPGTTVTLLPGGQQRATDADGCAVFSTLDPGSHTATVDRVGYVGLSGEQLASTTVGTVAGKVRRATIDYGVAGSLAVTLTGPGGYAPPSGVSLPVTLEMAQWSPTTRAFLDCATAGATAGSCVTSTPRTATRLFPASYTAWAGTCLSARPAATPARVQVQSSRTAAVSAALSGADVRVLARTGNSREVGRTVYARNTADAGCAAETLVIGTSTNADLKVALPQGTWTFSLTPDGSAGQQRTLVAGAVNSTRVDLRIP